MGFTVERSRLLRCDAPILRTGIPSSFRHSVTALSRDIPAIVATIIDTDDPLPVSLSALDLILISPEVLHFAAELNRSVLEMATAVSLRFAGLRGAQIGPRWKVLVRRLSRLTQVLGGFGPLATRFRATFTATLRTHSDFIWSLGEFRGADCDWSFYDFFEFVRDNELLSEDMLSSMSTKAIRSPGHFAAFGRILALFGEHPVPASFYAPAWTLAREGISSDCQFDEMVVVFKIAAAVGQTAAVLETLERLLPAWLETESQRENPFRVIAKLLKSNPPLQIRLMVMQYAQEIVRKGMDASAGQLAREVHRKFSKLKYFVSASLLDSYCALYQMLPCRELFAAIHKDLLVHRLVQGNEYGFLADRRMQSMANFSKIDEILSDFTQWQQTIAKFPKDVPDLRICVLNSALFTMALPLGRLFPARIRKTLDAFSEFYRKDRPKVVINWDLGLSNCHLAVTGASVRCSALCALFLLSTAERPQAIVKMASEMGIPVLHLQEVLQTLKKAKLVKEDSQGQVRINWVRFDRRICLPLSLSFTPPPPPNETPVIDSHVIRVVKEKELVSTQDLIVTARKCV
jgi:hypothetical protein